MKAVIHHWGVLFTGGTIVGSVSVYEHFCGKIIPTPLLWVAIYLSFFSAFFLTWRVERRKVNELEAQANATNKLRMIGEGLSQLYQLGHALFETIRLSDDELSMDECHTKATAWLNGVFEYIRDNASIAKARYTVQIETVQSASFSGMKSEKTRDEKTVLLLYHGERLSRLAELMKQY